MKDADRLVHIHVRFLDAGSDAPVGGPGVEARLFDDDPLSDDLLASAAVGRDGKAAFHFPLARVRSWDTPGETRPDIYVVLLRGGEAFFRSAVVPDVDVLAVDPVSRSRKGLMADLGVVRVPR